MTPFTPPDPDFACRVRESLRLQRLMATIGASMTRVEAGEVEIELPFRDDLTQQHGFIHAGIVTAIVDNACGFAAYTLMPADSDLLTVEYKVNFVSPAKGERFFATGRVIKPGRTLHVCTGEVVAWDGSEQKTVAVMQSTMMCLMRGSRNVSIRENSP